MAKEEYESEWKETYGRGRKKIGELKSILFQLQKVGQKRIDYYEKEIEDIPYETPKKKTRDKTKKTEEKLYRTSEELEDLSKLIRDINDELKDIERREQAYKSNEEKEKKKGEYNE